MSNKKFEFEILHEEVSDIDMFDDSTHKNVADTIYKFIEQTKKAVTIGIEGGWGSGKSTVIELLKNEISKDKNNESLFFVFDTWAHEGNPLRRIFLQRLINKLDPDETDEILSNLKKEISGKYKKIKISTYKKPSNLGRKLSVLALLVPAGTGLLSAVNYDNLSFIEGATFYWTFIVGVIFALAPFMYVMYWYFFGEKDKDNKIDWRYMNSESSEDYTQEVAEDGEQTSIEFEDYFKKILIHSIKQGKFKRIFIVIDNLDRVTPEHALNIWSTLQTFFQHRSVNKDDQPEWLEKVWFIIPYDKEALSEIWKSTPSSNTNAPLSFLSKSIQIRAEVPEPVMSAWYKYLTDSINKALKWSDGEKAIIINTYQKHMSTLQASPSPRSIHNFVNQVGFTGLQWGGKMSSEAIATYSLLRLNHTQQEIRKNLIGPDPLKHFDGTYSEEVRNELAGLLFNVEKNKGIQLLLKPVIYKAVTTGNAEEIVELIEAHQAGFWIAWKSSCKDFNFVTTSHDYDFLTNYAKILHDGMRGFYCNIVDDIKILCGVFQAHTKPWEMGKYDCVNLIIYIAEMLEDNSNFIDWCYERFDMELSIIFANMHDTVNTSEDDKLKFILSKFNSLNEFLISQNKPVAQKSYVELTMAKWLQFQRIIDAGMLDFVLPKMGTILELSKNMVSIPSGFIVQITPLDYSFILNYMKALEDLLIKSPTSEEWGEATQNILSFVTNPQIKLGNDDIYNLLLKLHSTHKSGGNIQVPIDISVSSQQFWNRAKSERLNKTPSLAILTGYILKDKIQSNSFISKSVKDFWKNEGGDEEFIYNTFKEIDMVYILDEIAKDEANILAKRAIEFGCGN